MVKLDRIYTSGGDKGETSLSDGTRVTKHSPRMHAQGDTDEANAAIGLALLHLEPGGMFDALRRIQNDLFDLGADLATPETGEALGYEPLRIVDAQVAWLEAEIDRLNDALSPLNSFILPGGSALAAHLHMARTVCRRAERAMTRRSFARREAISSPRRSISFLHSRRIRFSSAGWPPSTHSPIFLRRASSRVMPWRSSRFRKKLGPTRRRRFSFSVSLERAVPLMRSVSPFSVGIRRHRPS